MTYTSLHRIILSYLICKTMPWDMRKNSPILETSIHQYDRVKQIHTKRSPLDSRHSLREQHTPTDAATKITTTTTTERASTPTAATTSAATTAAAATKAATTAHSRKFLLNDLWMIFEWSLSEESGLGGPLLWNARNHAHRLDVASRLY